MNNQMKIIMILNKENKINRNNKNFIYKNFFLLIMHLNQLKGFFQ